MINGVRVVNPSAAVVNNAYKTGKKITYSKTPKITTLTPTSGIAAAVAAATAGNNAYKTAIPSSKQALSSLPFSIGAISSIPQKAIYSPQGFSQQKNSNIHTTKPVTTYPPKIKSSYNLPTAGISLLASILPYIHSYSRYLNTMPPAIQKYIIQAARTPYNPGILNFNYLKNNLGQSVIDLEHLIANPIKTIGGLPAQEALVQKEAKKLVYLLWQGLMKSVMSPLADLKLPLWCLPLMGFITSFNIVLAWNIKLFSTLCCLFCEPY